MTDQAVGIPQPEVVITGTITRADGTVEPFSITTTVEPPDDDE